MKKLNTKTHENEIGAKIQIPINEVKQPNVYKVKFASFQDTLKLSD